MKHFQRFFSGFQYSTKFTFDKRTNHGNCWKKRKDLEWRKAKSSGKVEKMMAFGTFLNRQKKFINNGLRDCEQRYGKNENTIIWNRSHSKYIINWLGELVCYHKNIITRINGGKIFIIHKRKTGDIIYRSSITTTAATTTNQKWNI